MSSTMSTETRAYLRERRRQQRIERASETAAATETQIARLAQAAFKDHVLTAEGPHWRCGRPDTGVYGFWLYAPAGAVMVWGGIGAFMLRHGSQDSLGWLAGAVRNGDPDYLLGKLCAADGAIREFKRGDAFRYIDEMVRGSGNAARWRAVRQRFHERLPQTYGNSEEANAFYAACHEHRADPCEAMGWASGPLYLWHALRVFARLHRRATHCGVCDQPTTNQNHAHVGSGLPPEPTCDACITPNQD